MTITAATLAVIARKRAAEAAGEPTEPTPVPAQEPDWDSPDHPRWRFAPTPYVTPDGLPF